MMAACLVAMKQADIIPRVLLEDATVNRDTCYMCIKMAARSKNVIQIHSRDLYQVSKTGLKIEILTSVFLDYMPSSGFLPQSGRSCQEGGW